MDADFRRQTECVTKRRTGGSSVLLGSVGEWGEEWGTELCRW
jgi:hypothetical protein